MHKCDSYFGSPNSCDRPATVFYIVRESGTPPMLTARCSRHAEVLKFPSRDVVIEDIYTIATIMES